MFLNTDNTTVREKEKKNSIDFLRVTIVTVIVTDSIMIDYDRFEGTNVAAIIAITRCTPSIGSFGLSANHQPSRTIISCIIF